MADATSVTSGLATLGASGWVPTNDAKYVGTGNAYTGTWAGRPSATTIGVGAIITVTDVPVGRRSQWYSDGTFWRPLNGRVQLANMAGTLAALLASASSVGSNVFTLSSSITIPGGMAIAPGTRICSAAVLNRKTLGGSPVAIGYCGTNLSASASSFSYSLPAIGILGLAATANQIANSFGAATVINAASVAGAQGYSGLNTSGVTGNYAEYAIDMTAATFVRVICDSLVSGDVVDLLSVAAWLEF